VNEDKVISNFVRYREGGGAVFKMEQFLKDLFKSEEIYFKITEN
jgi:hypothetical protein